MGHGKGGVHKLQICVKEKHEDCCPIFLGDRAPLSENECGKPYTKIWILKGVIQGPGGSACTPFLRSSFLYKIFHINFPGGRPVTEFALEKNNVCFTTKKLQLVYPPFDMGHCLVFPRCRY